ncbi:MAG: YlxR family protein [Candidatus Dormibacteraeota bacterium]|nr:YlxR family protein [Candidatus Dormibacteraeota bacterium]
MPKPRREPVRTCVACRLEASKGVLVRVVRRPDGTAAVDGTGDAPGRGAYVHSSAACIETARKRKALERSLKASIRPDVWAELVKTDTQVER